LRDVTAPAAWKKAKADPRGAMRKQDWQEKDRWKEKDWKGRY